MKRADARAALDRVFAERVVGHRPVEFEPQTRKPERFTVADEHGEYHVIISAHESPHGFAVIGGFDHNLGPRFSNPVHRVEYLAAD